jgi:hypothetical protein
MKISNVVTRILGGIFFAAFLFCGSSSAQTIELACPAGTQALQALNSTDNVTGGRIRQNWCVDNAGNVTQNANVNISLLPPMYFVGSPQYPTCPSAVIAATGIAGAIVIIPGTGPVVDCPATIPENITIHNFDRSRDWCNAGTSTSPCNAVNYNYDDGNVYAVERHEMTTAHQDLNGVTLGFYNITTLKNATANGTSGIDGASQEANTSGTLSGTFSNIQAAEHDSTIGSTGGTINFVTPVLGYANISLGSTTVVGTIRGLYGLGCSNITALNKPTVACYGAEFADQTSGGVGKSSGRNYSFIARAPGIFGYSGGLARGGMDAEDHLGAAHPFITFDSGDNTIIQGISANGIIMQDSTAANQQIISSAGTQIFTRLLLRPNVLLQNSSLTATMGITRKAGSGAGNYSSASTTVTAVDGTNLSFTVTIPTGWKLAIESSGAVTTSTAIATATVQLYDGTCNVGTALQQTQSIPTAATNPESWSLLDVITGDGASHTINLCFATSNAADSVTMLNSSASLSPRMNFILMPSN